MLAQIGPPIFFDYEVEVDIGVRNTPLRKKGHVQERIMIWPFHILSDEVVGVVR